MPSQAGRVSNLQEALTNAARHGDGSAAIEIGYGDGLLDLRVSNPVHAGMTERRAESGHGILGMHERAALLGGEIRTGRGNGSFQVRALLPYAGGHGERPCVTVMLVDDDDLMRAGLRAVLSSDPGVEVVGEAANGRTAVAAAPSLRPDLVLMDVRMPDLDGIAATRELLSAAPDVKVVILTTFEQDDYIFGALNAGASGFLLKRSPREPSSMIGVTEGGTAAPPRQARREGKSPRDLDFGLPGSSRKVRWGSLR